MDDLIKEMKRISEAFKAPDQALELDIQKIINALRTHGKVPAEDIEALDDAMHHPEKLVWAASPNPPDVSDFVPNYSQIEFFQLMIARVADGAEWTVPSTGQIYRIRHKDKTFTLIRNTQTDKDDWHSKTRVILEKIGWKMIDVRTTLRTFTANHKNWLLILNDFSIEDQENPATPGKNFPPGSRGQESFATLKTHGAFVRLAHRVGRAFMQGRSSDFGMGKSIMFGSKLGDSNKH